MNYIIFLIVGILCGFLFFTGAMILKQSYEFMDLFFGMTLIVVSICTFALCLAVILGVV
jgi:hypothetical protein